MKEILNVEPTEVSKSVIDSAYSMIEFGLVKKAKEKKVKKQAGDVSNSTPVSEKADVNGASEMTKLEETNGDAALETAIVN